MATITGVDTYATFKVGSTHGTAVQGGSGDQLIFNSLSHSLNVTELSRVGLGSGQSFLNDAQAGATDPSLSVDMVPAYDNAAPVLVSTFMGTSGTPTEQNASEGDYLHTMTWSEASKFGTIAFETSTTEVIEYPSCYPTALTWTVENPPNYTTLAMDFLANGRVISSTTNTNASLASVTETDSEEVVVQQVDVFAINAQGGGALSGSDAVDITSAVLNLTRPLGTVREIRGAAGNSAPIRNGQPAGTLTVQFADLDALTYFTAQAAGTEYKAYLSVEGTQIGAGDNKSMIAYLPRLKIIQDPEYNVTDPGNNPHSVVFMVLAATANPTGMSDNLPYFTFTNERSTAYQS